MLRKDSPAVLQAHAHPQSSSRGRPGLLMGQATQGVLCQPQVVAQSPFEAVALGLMSMAASGPEGTSEAATATAGGSAPSIAGNSVAVAGPQGRMDTKILLERIFTSVRADGGADAEAGSRTDAQQECGSVGSEPCSAAGRYWPGTRSGQQQLGTPTGSMRHEIQRQMEELKEELGSGHEDVPQWDVHSQLGKGAHGVVYKVSKRPWL